MTITSLNSLRYVIAFPILTLVSNAADASTNVEEESVPRMTAEEAEEETARIMAKFRALREPPVLSDTKQDVIEQDVAENMLTPPVAAQKPAEKMETLSEPAGSESSGSAPAKLASAPSASDSQTESATILAALHAIQNELVEQKQLIASQQALIQSQSDKIRQLELHNQLVRASPPAETPFALSQIRGAGMQRDLLAAAVQPDSSVEGLPDGPVGEAPPEAQNIERKVEAVPEGQGVLTPKGQFVLDPSIEYTRSSTNRLVFRGIELIPGIQIGAIEASDADRDTLVGTFAMRYGLSSRLEIEGRVPLLYRKDRIQVVQQRDDQIVREIGLQGTDIGDAEFALRYQLNRPKGQNPIWVAGLRVKSDTGLGPYDIPFDEFGVATGLATGSGFWGIQPNVSFLLPSDPVVIYGGLGYLWNIERDIDRIIGDVFIGTVDPGDAINANVGFGFALNPRFSFSLGYRHNYIFSTMTEFGDTVQESNDIQVGSFNFGMSYRLTEKQSLNLGFRFGVTEDAPDVGIVIRMPLRF